MTQRKFFTSLSLWRLRGYSNVRLVLGRKIVFVRHQYGHQELKGVAKEKLNRVLAIALLLNCTFRITPRQRSWILASSQHALHLFRGDCFCSV